MKRPAGVAVCLVALWAGGPAWAQSRGSAPPETAPELSDPRGGEVGPPRAPPSMPPPEAAEEVADPTREDNAVLRARDAFGERVGQEQVGLYNESQVRGFDLNSTASYRIEGRYIQREFQLPDPLLDGVTVKVGVAAARLNYPSPSGVVDYRLRAAAPGARTFNVTTGMKENGALFVESFGAYGSDDGRFSVAGGTVITPRSRFANKTGGFSVNAGAVPQWKPNENWRIRGVLSAERAVFNGELGYTFGAREIPPKPPNLLFTVPGAAVKRTSFNGGVLVDYTPSSEWLATLTVFGADTKRAPAEFTSLALLPDRTARVTFIRNDVQEGRSLTGEAAATRTFDIGGAVHSVNAALRGRLSRALSITRPPVNLGLIDTRNPVFPAYPTPPPAPGELNSDVDQGIGSVGYAGTYFDALEIKLSLHRSIYTKTVSPPLGAATERTDKKWLYDASAVLAVTPATTVFANTVRGVEESGTAPQNAVNRFEVLPPVVAREYEFGVRQQLTDTLAFSVAGFDTTKLTAGLRPDGVFALVGKVRHRGVEVSLAGQVVEGTSVVLGAMAMKPKLSGQLVDAGVVSRRPVGVSSSVAFAGVDTRFPWAPGWSFDARMSWQAGRAADATNTFGPDGFIMGSVGARFNFKWGEQDAQIRLLSSNMFGGRPFVVGPSGLFNQFGPTTYRATLRITF
ncbi:MAG: hypothetical protein SFV21_15705 [Rhodospirillaceae bacterium]|nr:hypothetical protein [Rhodospirillaceae bacterium]